MAIKHFIRFAVMFLAATLTASAQQFTATTKVTDPPYGMVAQLWNDTTATIYLDHIDVSAALDAGQTNGLLEFGIGYSHLEESQCKPALSTLIVDPINGPATSNDPNLRITQQPCTPNGLPYGQQIGPNQWNYTPTNSFNLSFCYGLACSIDLSNLAIPPNHGVTVYTAYYVEPYAFGWKGYAAVNFRGHR